MPFHTELPVQRLSIDIDLLTKMKTSQVIDVMDRLGNSLTDVEIRKHEPKKPYPIPNLVSFYVKYDSCLGETQTVKVDYLCELEPDLPTQSITNTCDIMEFKINYPAKILTPGALVGDKITTLALEKIGLRKSRFNDIPKQNWKLQEQIISYTK